MNYQECLTEAIRLALLVGKATVVWFYPAIGEFSVSMGYAVTIGDPCGVAMAHVESNGNVVEREFDVKELCA